MDRWQPGSTPISNRARSVIISLSAVSGPPLRGLSVCRAVCGRFRYSDLKEAALSGATVLWAFNVVDLLRAWWDSWICVVRQGPKREFVAPDVIRSAAYVSW